MRSLEDVELVIELGKPEEVVDHVIQEYLEAKALQPYLDAEAEYRELVAREHIPVVPPVLDDAGNVIEPEQDPDAELEDRIAELLTQFPYLIDDEPVRPPLVLDVADGKALKRLWIKTNMEHQIRSRYSLDDEAFLSRIGVGQSLGVYQMTEGEMQELLAYQQFVEGVREWGRHKREALHG